MPLHPAEIYKGDASYAYDGASTKFELRSMGAPDWDEGGHTNISLWLGTNGDIKKTWVEAIYTRGYDDQDGYYFVMGHQWQVGPDQYAWQDFSISLVPVVGHDVQFTAHKSYAQFATKVEDLDTGSWHKLYWDNHALPVNKYWVGGEYTCPAGTQLSRIDKTYVYFNQVRRASDNVWLTTPIGLLVPSGTSGSGMAWCNQPTAFRFWFNSSIPTAGCS